MNSKKPRPVATLRVNSIAKDGSHWIIRLYRSLDEVTRVMNRTRPRIIAGFTTKASKDSNLLGVFLFALGYTAPNIVAHEIFHALFDEVIRITEDGTVIDEEAEEQLVLDYECLFKSILTWLIDPQKVGV
jgi:hypothetical protein